MVSQKKYSVDGDLARRLDVIAAKSEFSPDELLKSIVGQYVNRHESSQEGEERRAFRRVDISIPAMIYVEEDGGTSVRYQPATIRDVSPGGMRVVCSGRKLCGRLASEYSPDLMFEVIFSFSEQMRPMRFRCKAARIELVGEELHIGARIIESGAEGRELYQKIVESDLCSVPV